MKRSKSMIKKTGLFLLLTALTTAILGTTVFAKQTAKIVVNGAKIITDVEPQIINDRVMVPLSFISTALGAKVNWDNNTKTASIQSQNVTQTDVWNQDLSKEDPRSYIRARNVVFTLIMKHDARDQSGRELVSDDYDSNVPGYTPDVIIPASGGATTIDLKVIDAKHENGEWVIRVVLDEWVTGASSLGTTETTVDFHLDENRFKIKGAWLVGQSKTLDKYTVFPGLTLTR
ncbi:copper amine oxidase N-terminal domain-containing protein [Paenibacillus humicola]|uniref:copper amine oxidase N-terminal domain-containing protein n=1 Tax=Paenibacillus humicola TaxID=3110540 RepID=UPI00237B8C56|nr:copper amine oxidase N-terminal domain-containing protein [Paenibacillus humicola]